MKITELSKKPELVKITIDRAELVEKYGDTIEFFILDRQPLDVFAKLSSGEAGDQRIIELVSSLILNEQGEPVMKDGMTLPIDIITECMTLIGTTLGK